MHPPLTKVNEINREYYAVGLWYYVISGKADVGGGKARLAVQLNKCTTHLTNVKLINNHIASLVTQFKVHIAFQLPPNLTEQCA